VEREEQQRGTRGSGRVAAVVAAAPGGGGEIEIEMEAAAAGGAAGASSSGQRHDDDAEQGGLLPQVCSLALSPFLARLSFYSGKAVGFLISFRLWNQPCLSSSLLASTWIISSIVPV